MFEHYLAALLSLGRGRDLAFSALPDAPVRPDREDRTTRRGRRAEAPAAPADTAEAAPTPAPVAGPNESSTWDPCPCRQWGVSRSDRHGCVAMCKELFPEVDEELDAWEAEHGWLYC
jgi:hypothetical protein